MKVAITGSTGLVGSRLIDLLTKEIEFIPLRHGDFDITDSEAVKKKLENIDYDYFLHLAAYTNVDGAETDRDTAYRLNVTGTKNINDAVQMKGKKMIYISTDFVFDGKNPPYFENSKPNPLGYYGQTKYEGEQILDGTAMIIRLSYPYRKDFEPKKDFVRTIKSLLEQGKELKMVTDSLMVPTLIDDFAFALSNLLTNFRLEVYHVVGSSAVSPFEAGRMIARNWNLDENLIQPTTYAEYFAGKALRPQYSDIRTNKNTVYKMKTFEEGLQSLI